jgi:hypothetical protein
MLKICARRFKNEATGAGSPRCWKPWAKPLPALDQTCQLLDLLTG